MLVPWSCCTLVGLNQKLPCCRIFVKISFHQVKFFNSLCYFVLFHVSMATFDPAYACHIIMQRCFKIHFTNQLCSLIDTHYDALMLWGTHLATCLQPNLAIFTPLLWFVHQQTSQPKSLLRNVMLCYTSLRHRTTVSDSTQQSRRQVWILLI